MKTPSLDRLPTCAEYADLLTEARRVLGIDRDEARNRYGMFTLRQWSELLGKEVA